MPSTRSLALAFMLANSAAAFMNPANGASRTHVTTPQTSNFGARSYVAPQTSKTALFMSTSTGKDFYKILGVTRGSDAAAIKAGYRKMAKQWHPGECYPWDRTNE